MEVSFFHHHQEELKYLGIICKMKDLSDFGGVWRRTKLYEPIGTLGPEEEQLKDVLWIQSRNGYFIDIRYQDGASSHLKMKSFAGVGSFEESNFHFTWDRKFDFRAPGAPDIGLMRLLQGSSSDPLQLEEDGVLPGDDYREIWDRLSGSVVSTDFTARVVQTSGQTLKKQGLFLIVGDWFAITTSRTPQADTAALDAELKRVFDEAVEDPSASVKEYLWDYFCVVGSTATWEVIYSLHPELRGTSILPGRCAHPLLSALIQSASPSTADSASEWTWDVLEGVLPEALATTA